MAKDRDKIEEGLDVIEMERGAGWKLVRAQIETEIAENTEALKDLDIDRDPATVGSDYVSRIQRINGLRRTLEIVQGFKDDKAKAEQES